MEARVNETRPSNRSPNLDSILLSHPFVHTPHSLTSRTKLGGGRWAVRRQLVINVFRIWPSSGSSTSRRASSTSRERRGEGRRGVKGKRQRAGCGTGCSGGGEGRDGKKRGRDRRG